MDPVLVLGATGNLGGAATRALLDAGRPVRVAGRSPERLRARFPGADAVRLDLGEPATFGPALRGTGGLFLVRPPAVSRVGPTVNALIDAAADAGCSHVVFASVTGADRNPLVPHHRIERHLMRAAPAWTILRPGFFAQNLADAYGRDIREHDAIVLPAGRGRAAFIDTRDVGDVAALILTAPDPHRRRAYTLTGPEPLGFDAVAAILSDTLGRAIRYRPVGVLPYVRHLRRAGLPRTQALVQTVLHVGLRAGQADHVDASLPSLLGRAPRTLAQYVHDHRDLWNRA